MKTEEFNIRARRHTRRARSPAAPILEIACRFRGLRGAAIRYVCRLEGGEMWSLTFRELLRRYYDVEVGIHSYGPCLRPGYLPPGTRVGNYCSLAAGIQVLRRNHPIDRLSQHPFFFNSVTGLLDEDTIGPVTDNPLTIGHDVWLGFGVVVAPGCRTIGNGAVVAAQSVLTADVPPLAVVGGVPAKFIRWRFPQQLHDAWLGSGWWLKPVDALPLPIDSFLEPFGSGSGSGDADAGRVE